MALTPWPLASCCGWRSRGRRESLQGVVVNGLRGHLGLEPGLVLSRNLGFPAGTGRERGEDGGTRAALADVTEGAHDAALLAERVAQRLLAEPATIGLAGLAAQMEAEPRRPPSRLPSGASFGSSPSASVSRPTRNTIGCGDTAAGLSPMCRPHRSASTAR